MGTGNTNFWFPLSAGAEETEILHQPQGSHGQLAAYRAVIEVVVELFRSAFDLHAGQPLEEVIDHIVAAELSVGNDVEAGHLLIFDGGLDGGVMDLVQIVPGDAAGKIFGLEPFEPARHGVAANYGGGKDGKFHRCYSRCVV